MSNPQRVRGVKILKAVSSPLRLQILNLLFDKGPLSYTELMNALKMNPTRDAGRFAYHLKFLLKADLIEAIVETKKYGLTDLGKMVIDVAERIDKKALKPKNILIRSSRAAIEEFDPNKIANALIREARMPAEEAQKVAKEAEKQLLKAKTKYLTAPLVREVVNAILIDKGLEEYRNKLTRLGIPVHDVATLIQNKQAHETIHEKAGQNVLKEYTLLNALPRDIADAHLSGAIHINHLTSWILKPTETIHDTRFFQQNGLNLEKIDPTQLNTPPPQTLETALTTITNALLHAAKETDATQTLEYFNIFLAPYTKNQDQTKTKQALTLFITSLSQHVDTSINLELTIPSYMAEKPTQPKSPDKYADYTEQAQTLVSLILDIYEEQSLQKPLFNPKLIIKIRPETHTDQRAKALLAKAHKLATETGLPYFANLTQKNPQTTYSPSGFKLDIDLDNDWETDTIRTGCLGTATVNIPRAAVEAGTDKTRFYEILKERMEMANRALEIKHRALKQNSKTLLPFLTQNENGDQYFRLENTSSIINLAGLKEAAEILQEKNVNTQETLNFIEETAQTITAYVHKIGKRRGKRLHTATLPNPEAAQRLAQVDIERYGIAKIRISGTREKPYYSTAAKLTVQNNKIPQEQLNLQNKLTTIRTGGNLTIIELEEKEHQPDELAAITQQLTENGLEFFTYNRKQTYCTNCKKTFHGLLHKCPSCNTVDTLAFFDRFTTT